MNNLTTRIFKIWAYNISHSFLIIRSPLKFPDQEGFKEGYEYNIDIEFSAVAYLDIPAILDGVIIKELRDNIPPKFYRFKFELNYKIFEIESEKNLYYVVAGNYRIGKNKWLNDSRITNVNLEYDFILEGSS